MLGRVVACRVIQSNGLRRRLIHTKATREGWLFVDSVFPIQVGSWDLRTYIGILRQDTLLNSLKAKLSRVKAHDFTILELDPHFKDGGVFVRFQYSLPPEGTVEEVEATSKESENLIDTTASDVAFASDGHTPQERRVLRELETLLNEQADSEGGLPSWLGLGRGSVWLVRGSPWREDMNRFAFPVIKVAFEGPDVQEQTLYQLFRPYGRIQDLALPTPAPAGTLRSSTVSFTRLRSATIARNVLHGLQISSDGAPSNAAKVAFTRLRTAYQPPIRAHVIRDWIAGHPRIVLPVVVFLFGTFTYTVFDPIRSLMVQSKMLNWFDYRETRIYKWIISNTYDKLPKQLTSTFYDTNEPCPAANACATDSAVQYHASRRSETRIEGVWKERQEAERLVRTYLDDLPNTVAFLHGPQGSGKTRLLDEVLKDSPRHVMYVDCRELQKASSDSLLVGGLARQTGYWPIFTFFDSMSNLLDLASVGLIGQKAGFSTSVTDQLNQVLTVVTRALQAVSASHVRAAELERVRAEQAEKRRAAQDVIVNRIRHGTWHDGRIDVVSGTGVISELGVGDEPFGILEDESSPSIEPSGSPSDQSRSEAELMREAMIELGKPEGERQNDRIIGQEKKDGHKHEAADADALAALPIVIIRNYAVTNKAGGSKEELLAALAQWAANLSENQIAHVIVVSDNRENSKRLAKALPSKPLNSIALSDADTSSALSFLKQRMNEASIDVAFSQKETELVERLGGRASDLESLIHKMRNGQGVEEAVEDIIVRGVSELRKNAFGDDADDAKGLAWTREQAWAVLKILSKKTEASYHEVLIEFPFKGDESALRGMEHAELISIGTTNGRPSTIRPGKPVYKYVFERLVQDPIFQASQDIAYNERLISSAEKTIQSCEEELRTLETIREQEARARGWVDWAFGWVLGSRACDMRAAYLFDKMGAAEKKLEGLEKKNAELKKVFAKSR